MDDTAAFRVWFDSRFPGREAALEALLLYGAAILRHRGRGGLISRNDGPVVLMRHVAESMAPPVLEAIPPGALLLDIGSGAGFPGIPIAVMRPDVRVALVEPREKKTAFLEREVLRLGLRGARVERATVEELARRGLPEPAPVAISRGLRWLPGMLRALGVCLAPDGELLRFGERDSGVPGVVTRPLDTGADRGLQRWPRDTWGALLDAR